MHAVSIFRRRVQGEEPGNEAITLLPAGRITTLLNKYRSQDCSDCGEQIQHKEHTHIIMNSVPQTNNHTILILYIMYISVTKREPDMIVQFPLQNFNIVGREDSHPVL